MIIKEISEICKFCNLVRKKGVYRCLFTMDSTGKSFKILFSGIKEPALKFCFGGRLENASQVIATATDYIKRIERRF